MNRHSITLPTFFKSGMIFQRDKEIHIYGDAAPLAAIAADFYSADNSTSGRLHPILSGKANADASGHFLLTLPPLPASESLSLQIYAENTGEPPILLTDISFGDIWIAAGQSNMEFFLKYDKDFEAVSRLPRNPEIHMFNMPQQAFCGHSSHNRSGYGYWFRDDDSAVNTFSAPAYSFAREIQEAAGIPIGIIGCNWGGSSASAWVPEEVLQKPPLDTYLKAYEDAVRDTCSDAIREVSLAGWTFEDSLQHSIAFEPLLYGISRAEQLTYMKEHETDPVIPMGPYNFNRPCGLYEQMLSSLIPFSIKGVLWYQGESDAGELAPMYDKLLSGLIRAWRNKWQDNFPFLLVQLAPFGEWLSCDSKGYAIVREKQELTASTLPDVFLTGIMDLGSYYDIHPKEKMEVGRRLALLARGHVYGEPILCDSPKAVSASLTEEGTILVSFAHAEGLNPGKGGSDFLLHTEGKDPQSVPPAAVKINGTDVILTPPDTLSLTDGPCSVSLGYRDYAEIHLQNAAGLTALPFQLPVQRRSL